MALNTQDYIKGSRPVISLADFVTGGTGGSPSFSDVGTVSDFEWDADKSVKFVEADSSFAKLDAFFTGQGIKGKFTMLEAALGLMAKAMGDPDASVATAGTTPNQTKTYKLDEQSALRYFRLQVVIANQSFVEGGVTYIKRMITFWKVLLVPKIKQAYKKDGVVMVPCEFEVMYDSTAVAAGDGAFGKIVDSES